MSWLIKLFMYTSTQLQCNYDFKDRQYTDWKYFQLNFRISLSYTVPIRFFGYFDSIHFD